ncbi:MAG: hypothetical protein IH795_10830, partial [Bacteroidetes bacterium]|nr:hypothetical protein [Bacteroidota bacterium]
KEAIEKDKEYVKNLIKAEIAAAFFGRNGRFKVKIQKDIQVLKALELLPKAKDLADAVLDLKEN